ncbi:MAG: DNA polymerase III subunit [Candidatus Omnitrophota bacterium]
MQLADNILDNAVKSGSLPHAYIFSGQDKAATEKTALKLAACLNCLEKKDSLCGCGKCISCTKIGHFNHPDIMHIRAEEDSRQIKIEQIRSLQRHAHLKAIEARKKVYILYDADTMTEEASNCLLKTLEEPPKDVIIILISSNLSVFLATIISRCQVIKFSEAEYMNFSEKEIALANELLNAPDRFSAESLEFTGSSRQRQLRVIDLLLLYFRDALIHRFLEDKINFISKAKQEDIQKISQRYSAEGTLELMKEVFKSKTLVQANVNSKLVADYLLDRIVGLKG